MPPVFLPRQDGWLSAAVPVKFLGHGIELLIDELPMIARGFDEPLIENMVFPLEPKKGIPKVGIECLTVTHPELMLIE